MGEQAHQEEVLASADDEALVERCTNAKDQLYFTIDQINAFDTCEEAPDCVSKAAGRSVPPIYPFSRIYITVSSRPVEITSTGYRKASNWGEDGDSF